MDLLTVEYDIPGYSKSEVDLSSRKSMADVDTTLISTNLSIGKYGHHSYSTGNWSFETLGSKQFKEDVAHWRQAIKESVEAGETVFILMGSLADYLVMTGSVQSNRSTPTYGTETRNNYEVLPMSFSGLANSQGKNIVTNNKAGSYFELPEKLSERFEYQVTFNASSMLEAIYFTKNMNKLVGATVKIGQGNLVLLPDFSYDYDQFTTQNSKGQTVWTKDALVFGKEFVDFLSNIDKHLKNSSLVSPPPNWANASKYESEDEKKIANSISANEEKIRKLVERSNSLQKSLIEESVFKCLLYETGKSLERAVIASLVVLGYSAAGYDDGTLELDQVIVSPEGERMVGECEGKDNKAINVQKFRQLLDSLAADFERDEISEKAYGIIFGNPFRLTKPEKRAEWFTAKAIAGAQREKIALIKTPDLHRVTIYIKNSGDQKFAQKCRVAIKNGMGTIVNFPSLPLKKDVK